MLATASRGVNGRLRQKPFGEVSSGIGNVVLKKDKAPFKKRAKPTVTYSLKNSPPVLFTPLKNADLSEGNGFKYKVNRKPVAATSRVRIKKNHRVELKTLNEDLRPIREAIAALAFRPEGTFGRPQEGNAKTYQDLREGDFVVLLR